ncbi:putative ring finger protein [Hibiscus syriacus]|uniref:Ring finger protein n=1 Tax=Hibiscus syriacus TaxID=106335 RepID=A0A6A2Z0D7_HIBSY|nr:putative ring finger protein [Hibiscus syriacus]
MILEFVAEGLGIQLGYFGDKLSEYTVLAINHYPPCPDPSLTLGISKHCDPKLLTILHQGDVNGLQVFNNGEWIGVEPLHNAIVVNIGNQLQIISNNKLKSAKHRVVTNSNVARTTPAFFMAPSLDSIIEPAKSLTSDETRPGNFIVPTSKTSPVIDLRQNRANIVQQVLKASEEYGFFQVINHGIPNDLIEQNMDVFKEFFDMPAEDKAMLYSEDPTKSCRLLTSGFNNSREKVIIGVTNWNTLAILIYKIASNFGLRSQSDTGKWWEYFRLKQRNWVQGSWSLLLKGGVKGLQVFNDGESISVEPLHNALDVNIGNLLQIINNRLKSVEHRAVTNSTVARTSAAFFITPSDDSIIEPAKSLIGDTSHYRT